MDEQGRTILRRSLTGAIVIVVILALGWFIFIRDSGSKEQTRPAAGTSTAQKEDNKQKSDPATSGTGESGNQAAGTSPGANQSVAGAPDRQLVATGSAGIVSSIISTVVIATAGHYAYSRYRASRRHSLSAE